MIGTEHPDGGAWLDEDGTVYGKGGPKQPVDPLPAPSNPMGVAREIVVDYTVEGALTLRQWRGSWMRWVRTHWEELEERAVRAWAYEKLEHATYEHVDKGETEVRDWQPNRRKIADVLDALGATTHLPETVDTPAWLGPSTLPPGEVVACGNGLLHVPTRTLSKLTPRYFNRVAVPFDFDDGAPEPKQWLKFLGQLWPDDADAIAALREYFGYVISGRTDLQKIMLLIGPTRAGKGVIARVLTQLVGKGSAAGPTLASLGTNFGLSPLLGKPLAIVSDARLGGQNTNQVVERLLSISGEDMLTVDRKYREPWTGKLPARFLILSNELPRFGDASGAIANRFVVLSLSNSWLGNENPQLTTELLTELPGILAWALDGLDTLAERGTFTEPQSSRDSILALQDLVSPVAAFVRDRCTTGAGMEVAVAELYASWRLWCEDNGRDRPGTVQTFGRDLRAAIPGVRVVQPRDGATRERRYTGIDRSTAHNGSDRVPPRAASPERGGTRSEPLWAQPEHEAESEPRPGQPSEASDPACRACGNTTRRGLLDGRCRSCHFEADDPETGRALRLLRDRLGAEPIAADGTGR